MIGWIRKVIEGERPDSPPPATPGFSAQPIGPERPQPVVPVGTRTESPLRGQGFLISYTDASGFQSERRVRVSTVFQAGQHVYVAGFCYEAAAPRQFRADRIEAVFCATHGDDLGDPVALFVPVEIRAPLGSNLKRPVPLKHKDVRATLRALLAVARCDGHSHPGEMDVIRVYLREVLPADVDEREVEEMVQYSDRLVADFNEFLKGVDVAMSSPALAQPFLMAAAAVAAADGRLADEERTLLEDLRWVASGHGIELG